MVDALRQPHTTDDDDLQKRREGERENGEDENKEGGGWLMDMYVCVYKGQDDS